MRHLFAAILALLPGLARAAEITVFAAASLGPALEEAGTAWEAESGHAVTISPAGSSALARQIAQGAPADLFVSANAAWMDRLEDEGLIDAATRRDLIANRLVLIAAGPAPETGRPPPEVGPGTDISALLGDGGRLAMALVDAVPAGIYGRQALVWAGRWEALGPRVAQADNVRAALMLVALGEAPAGIVYATDAAAEPRVHVVARFPAESHDPIRYPGAVTSEAREPEAARAFLDWLGGATAQAILARHGFEPAPE